MDSLVCIFFGLCGRWMVTNRTGEVADLFGGGWLTDQRWAFSFKLEERCGLAYCTSDVAVLFGGDI